MTTTARWAARYIERFGMALTWTPEGGKGPRHQGWNLMANAITDPNAATAFWNDHPDYGVGALLSFSGLVSLDIDDVDNSRLILLHFGIALDELRQQAPCIVGNPAKFRLIFQAPADIDLRHRTVIWPKQANPKQGFAVFELRAGPISDALPPSIHTGTGLPYRWETAPSTGFPPLPAALLSVWLDWPNFNIQARALCPWAPPPRSALIPRSPRRESAKPSVIEAFNAAHDAAAILQAHGYEKRGKNRFASPDTANAAGVVLLESGRVFSHHQGDVLGGEHAHDAFDLYRLLEHGGDWRAAVKTAANLLGIQA